MWWYEPEVKVLEEKCRALAAGPDPVVFYGSSSIRLWTHLSQDFPHVGAVNLGFGGSTLAACVHFFDRLVVPCRPRSLIVYAGDNDLGEGQPPGQVVKSFEALASKVHDALGDIPWAFLSIKPSPARWDLVDRTRLTNRAVQEAMAHIANGIYVDVFRPMLSAAGRPRPELFLADGLHLSPAGYRLWRDTLLQYRQRLFNRAVSTPSSG